MLDKCHGNGQLIAVRQNEYNIHRTGASKDQRLQSCAVQNYLIAADDVLGTHHELIAVEQDCLYDNARVNVEVDGHILVCRIACGRAEGHRLRGKAGRTRI